MFEILHELYLALAVAGPHRNGTGSQPLGPVMETKPAGEQAIGHHILKYVCFAHAGHEHGAGERIGSGIKITGRVEDDR